MFRRAVVLSAALVAALIAPAPALADAAPPAAPAPGAAPDHRGGPGSDAVLRRYAADTWRSLTAMTDPRTGLPADNIEGDLTAPSGETSPTNIGS